MCGRYFLFLSPERLKQLFATENLAEYIQSAQITPMQSCPVIVQRRMGLARWGLLPSYAESDDKTLCAKLKNARSETIHEKASFAELWRRGRRCLIPASGFYEWPEVKVKGHPPYTVTANKSECIAFAGLWNKTDDLVTYTILTQPASPALAHIHSRMPVAFYPDQAERWFAATPQDAAVMMAQDSIRNDWVAEGERQEALFA